MLDGSPVAKRPAAALDDQIPKTRAKKALDDDGAEGPTDPKPAAKVPRTLEAWEQKQRELTACSRVFGTLCATESARRLGNVGSTCAQLLPLRYCRECVLLPHKVLVAHDVLFSRHQSPLIDVMQRFDDLARGLLANYLAIWIFDLDLDLDRYYCLDH